MKLIISLLAVVLIWPSLAQAKSRLTWDLGYSLGSTGGESYSELNLGINWFATDWFTWRNALFNRSYSTEGIDDVYGLDTSARVHKTFEFDQSSNLTIFGGPGWRFASEGESPPFVEGGVNLRIGGLSLTGGAKVIFNEVTDSAVPNDTQYFIGISGSGVVGGGSN